jgi:hypothetical protein
LNGRLGISTCVRILNFRNDFEGELWQVWRDFELEGCALRQVGGYRKVLLSSLLCWCGPRGKRSQQH